MIRIDTAHYDRWLSEERPGFLSFIQPRAILLHIKSPIPYDDYGRHSPHSHLLVWFSLSGLHLDLRLNRSQRQKFLNTPLVLNTLVAFGTLHAPVAGNISDLDKTHCEGENYALIGPDEIESVGILLAYNFLLMRDKTGLFSLACCARVSRLYST